MAARAEVTTWPRDYSHEAIGATRALGDSTVTWLAARRV